MASETISDLLKAQEQIREWLKYLDPHNFDWSTETHPGGWKLGVFDVTAEEVLILLQLREMEMEPNSYQVGGEHYREANADFQHWDLVEVYGLSYFIGNMTKYVCRWRKKHGVKDLEKAIHYLDKYISLTKSGRYLPQYHRLDSEVARKFCEVQNLEGLERDIILMSVAHPTLSDLMDIQGKLKLLILETQKINEKGPIPLADSN